MRTDKIRKELEDKKYSLKARQGVYEEMFLRARALLRDGYDVILDGTFYSRKWREAAKNIAKSSKADFKIVEAVCPEDLVRKRMSQRRGSESDAKFKHYLIYKKLFQPIKEKHLIVDTSRDIERQLKKRF